MIFALVGNQNCGKTTLFNQLTGSNQHVGNFPGVTVEQKSGQIKSLENCSIVDLPGIYSIRPYSQEEVVTRDFILNNKPDAILNIIDATNIERNLYLTLQMLELQVPMVIALNMMDEVRNNGGTIDINKLSSILEVPVIPISAVKREGLEELTKTIYEVAKKRQLPQKIDFCEQGSPAHRCIHAVSHLIEDHAVNIGIPARFVATKIIENDRPIIDKLELDENEKELLEHTVKEMEDETGLDRNAAIADMRYSFIEKVCAETVVKCKESKEHRMSVNIDKVLTNKYLAIPLFAGIMFLIFYLTFDVLGALLSDLLNLGITKLSDLVNTGLVNYGINDTVRSLVVDGIFTGVGSVISFLPIIIILFFFLSILEDTGYIARVAFVMDKLLRKIGLSGRSIVPLLIGFGCSVPAIMSTRTLSSDRDRRLTVLLTPFMSCSAKIPIYAVFTAAFFAKYRALVMFGLYAIGIIIGIIVALILKDTRKFKGNPVPFVMELPNYRLPSPKSVAMLLWDKAKDFLKKAFTVIFVATIIIWFLQTFDLKLNVAKDSSTSLLALIGKLLAPVFQPLGFADWRVATSIIAGFTAKEAVVSTLAVLTGTSLSEVGSLLGGMFSTASALSFLVFTLLYTPCIAAITSIRKEFHSHLLALVVVIGQCVIAWIASFITYRLALMIGSGNLGAADVAVIVTVAVLFAAAVVYMIIQKRKGKSIACGCDCSACGKCATCGQTKKIKK